MPKKTSPVRKNRSHSSKNRNQAYISELCMSKIDFTKPDMLISRNTSQTINHVFEKKKEEVSNKVLPKKRIMKQSNLQKKLVQRLRKNKRENSPAKSGTTIDRTIDSTPYMEPSISYENIYSEGRKTRNINDSWLRQSLTSSAPPRNSRLNSRSASATPSSTKIQKRSSSIDESLPILEEDAFYSREKCELLVQQSLDMRQVRTLSVNTSKSSQETVPPEQLLMIKALNSKPRTQGKSNWPMLVLRNDFAQQL